MPRMGSSAPNEVVCKGEGVDVKVEPDALIYGAKAVSRESFIIHYCAGDHASRILYTDTELNIEHNF